MSLSLSAPPSSPYADADDGVEEVARHRSPAALPRSARHKKKAARKAAFARSSAVVSYAVVAIAPVRRRICRATPPKPMIIIAQVESSGTPPARKLGPQ